MIEYILKGYYYGPITPALTCLGIYYFIIFCWHAFNWDEIMHDYTLVPRLSLLIFVGGFVVFFCSPILLFASIFGLMLWGPAVILNRMGIKYRKNKRKKQQIADEIERQWKEAGLL